MKFIPHQNGTRRKIACTSIIILFLLIFSAVLIKLNDPDRSNSRMMINREWGFQLRIPSGWLYLPMPNDILQYPQAAAQMIHESKKAVGVLIPEKIEPSVSLTMNELRELFVQTIKEEHPEAEILSITTIPSSWSRCERIEYRTTLKIHQVRWLLQIYLTETMTYRLICWTDEESYLQYKDDFIRISESLKPLE